MTRNKIIAIIVVVAVTAAVIAAVFWVRGRDELPEKPTESTDVTINHENEKYLVYKCNLYDVTSVNVVNGYGEYTLKRDISGNITFAGSETVPLQKQYVKLLYESVDGVYALSTIEKNSTNLDWYGLENPSATVKISFRDGTSAQILVGDPAPLGDGYYIRMEDSRDVYLGSNAFAGRFLQAKTGYYETFISTEAEYATGFVRFSVSDSGGRELSVRRTSDEESSQLRYYGGTVLEKPFHFPGSYTPVEQMMKKLCFLSADVVGEDFSAEKLAEYGLDRPTTVTITVNTDTKNPISSLSGRQNPYYDASDTDGFVTVTNVYYVGKTDAGKTYLMFNDSTAVYSADAEVFDWLQDPADVWCVSLLALHNITDLSTLTLEYEGREYVFRLKWTGDDDLSVSCDGYGQIDQQAFREFYVTCMSVTCDGLVSGDENESGNLLKIVYGVSDGDDTVMEFTDIGDRKVLLRLDGEGAFFAYATKVNKIASELLRLLSDK